ncbi:MAG: DNA mismatch repair protein MutS [Salibacteraceae bacterium]|jgi:DNA mismatch repair protein MutS
MAAKKTKDTEKETPLMRQYNSFKSKYPDAILLFRVGDFYETFGSDAILASKILGIVLTKRKNGAAATIELAGFPHHSLDTYLPKLVRAGQRVALCDQLEDSSVSKGTKNIVKRGITELVTPGVSTRENTFDHNKNNYLASVYLTKKEAGISFLDISTGEFLTTEGPFEYIDKLLQSFDPTEILVERHKKSLFIEHFGAGHYIYYLDEWVFTEEYAQDILLKHFHSKNLKGYGIQDLNLGIIASGACLHYLKDTQHHQVGHINNISRIEKENHVWLDRFTIRNLELFYSPNENAKTLISILDEGCSPMGARLMKRWLALPLKHINPILDRQIVVKHFLNNDDDAQDISGLVKQIGDLERLISKVALQRINPREVVALKRSLQAIEPIITITQSKKCAPLKSLSNLFNPCNDISARIETELNDDAPVQLVKGNTIEDGVSPELDELRLLLNNSKQYLKELQERESKNSGIPSLKIGFNNVFGYYFEVRNNYKDKVPEEWNRKQTLVNAERYITEELKEYETKILGAEDKILAIENNLFSNLLQDLTNYIEPIQLNARLIAKLDCLIALSRLAKKQNYCQPEINDSLELDIKDGRHPVIEQLLPVGESYIPNDLLLNNEEQQIMMITGPNMSGKSALLRQSALIVLLAQIGSYVPASSAKIGLVDKVFTRVGASDNISMGESTFMVEMNETASILNNLSERSLILLDEIGRGTSTYDGISIAWAIAEFIHNSDVKPKTLFATHYHELNEMSKAFNRIQNYNVSIKELNKKIIFIRKLEKGGSNHSFGIHVAKMAGMPDQVINKANEVLTRLEQNNSEESNSKIVKEISDDQNVQLSFFQLDDPALIELKNIIINTNINALTPIEALMKLNEIKNKLIKT